MSRPQITPELVEALASGVPRRAGFVWFYVWSRADRQTAEAWPGVRTIAKAMGLKPGHVCEDVGLLESRGWLTVNRSPGNKSTYLVCSPQEPSSEAGHSVYPETGTPSPVSVCQNGNGLCPETGTDRAQKREQHPNTTKNTTKNTKRAHAFIRPTLPQVEAYCRERGNHVDPQRWFAYYQSNGWRVGRNAMKDWRAAVRTWERNGFSNGRAHTSPSASTKPMIFHPDGSITHQ